MVWSLESLPLWIPEASPMPGRPVVFLCLLRVFFACCSVLGCGELKYGPVVEGFLVSCLLTSFHFTTVLLTKPPSLQSF